MKRNYTILLSCIALSSSALTCLASSIGVQQLSRQIDEERLAYQLYTTLGEHYPELRQFQNIPKAEKRHFSALSTYAMTAYPTLDTGTLNGPFIHPETQTLYATLLAEGITSASAALHTGVQVEKLDIRDLDEALNSSPPADLQAIYENLRRGSENHLAAFSGGNGRNQHGNQNKCGRNAGPQNMGKRNGWGN